MLRAFGELRAKDDRTVQFIISDETKDRHGTIIKMDGWRLDNFNRNPIVAYMHETSGGFSEPNPDMILGPGRAWVEDGKLIGEVKFETEDINPLADKIYRKIQYGTLRTASVGFDPIAGSKGDTDRGEDSNTYYFRDQELLEFSVVNIPSNPNALKRMMSPMDEFVEKELEQKETVEFEKREEEKESFRRPLSRERLDYLKLI